MPKCPYCNKNVLNNSDLKSVKDSEGLVSISCSKCINTHKLLPLDHVKRDSKKQSGPAISKDQLQKIESELLKKINSILDEISQNNSLLENKESYKRAHERHDVSLEMQFSFVRDNKMYRAKVLDISQGGMKFETEVKLDINQHLKGEIFKPPENKNEKINKIENYMEVRRVIALENDLFQIGARFVKKISIDEKDRRKNIRKKGTFSFFFTRQGSEITYRGKVINISPGGMKAQVHAKVETKETIEVFMKTRPPAFAPSDLSATFNIKRIELVYENCFNVSGSFDNLNVIQI